MKEKIKKYIGEIFVIIGSGLFSYNIFSFFYQISGTYDSPDLLTLISIGAMLIISGILIIRRKK